MYRHVLRLKKLFDRFHAPHQLSPSTIEPPKLLLDLAREGLPYGFRFSILSSSFSDKIPFLDMAQSICTRLQKHRVSYRAGQSDLDDQFENLLCRFHHHHGELSLHTNQPKLSLSSYNTFIQILRDQIGDRPRGTDQSPSLDAPTCIMTTAWKPKTASRSQLMRLVLSTAQRESRLPCP